MRTVLTLLPTLALALLAHTANAADQPRLCLDITSLSTQPDCKAAFAAALQSAADPEEVVVTAPGSGLMKVGRTQVQPLQFQKRAPWVRRLERLGKEGIPFVRRSPGPDSELVIGINRKGRLGFEVKRTPR